MRPEPRVSVVIPVFNAESFVAETLDSLRLQTLPIEQIEVIVANDGSTDGSLEILKEYQRTALPSMKILDLPNSGTAAAPRNAGLAEATGEFVQFVDADDLLAPRMLEDVLALADETGSDIVLARMVNFGDGARRIPRRVFERTRRAEDFIESFAYRTLGPWKLFRRELLVREGLQFPSGYHNGEDQPFVMGAYLAANHISAASDQEYYRLRNHAENISRKPQPAEAELTKVLTLSRAILAGTAPGPRRDILLERPIVGSAGLVLAFGKRFAKLDPDRQTALFDRAQELAPLWTDGLRAMAPPATIVMLDLLFSGNIQDLRTLSSELGASKELRLTASAEGVSYRGASQIVAHVSPTVTASIDQWTPQNADADLVIAGYAQANVSVMPDTCRLVWTLREAPSEVTVDVHLLGTAIGDAIVRFDFEAFTTLESLSPRGTWDAHLELGWGPDLTRVRLGDRRANAPKGTARRLKRRTRRDIVFLTEYANLSVDAGHLRKHAVLSEGTPGPASAAPAPIASLKAFARRVRNAIRRRL